MQESVKRTRIEMTCGGLQYLLQCPPGTLLGRAEFFVPSTTPEGKKLDVMRAELAHKAWQRGVLQRLMAANLVTQEGQKYRLYDSQLARKLLDLQQKGGTAITHFVFPNEVPSPLKSAGPQLELPGTADKLESESSELDLAQAISLTLNALASLTDSNENNFGTIQSALNAQLHAQGKTNKAIESNNETLKQQHNLVQAQQAVIKRLDTSLYKFVQVAELLPDLIQAVENMTTAVENLSAEVKKNSLSKLAEVARNIQHLTSDLTTVQEMVMSVAEESEK